MNFDPLLPRLETLLESRFDKSGSHLQITGCSSALPLAFLLAQTSSPTLGSSPHLIVVPGEDEALNLKQALSFFAPEQNIHILPEFDVSPYTNLHPNHEVVAQRIHWLHRAQQTENNDLFVASVSALMQKCLPSEILGKHTSQFFRNDILPANLPTRLQELGYSNVPLVEDVGSYALRGGIVDIFSPAHQRPVRIELFGDNIDSLRTFDPDTQASISDTESFYLVPARECLYSDENRQQVAQSFSKSALSREVNDTEKDEIQHSLVHAQFFPGMDFLLPDFYSRLTSPSLHFRNAVNIWLLDPIEIARTADMFLREMKSQAEESQDQPIWHEAEELFLDFEKIEFPPQSHRFEFSKIAMLEQSSEQKTQIGFRCNDDFLPKRETDSSPAQHSLQLMKSLVQWRQEGFKVFITCATTSQAQRLQLLLEKHDVKSELENEDDYLWQQWYDDQTRDQQLVHIIPRGLPESLMFHDERLIFLREEDFFGTKFHRRKVSHAKKKPAAALDFSNLNPGDYVVHILHGVGIYEGLKVMSIQGVDSEYMQVKYKDNDRLYLPIYRIGQLQKYSGPQTNRLVDKLGGTSWEKAKTKVKNNLRDMADELLRLYAQRKLQIRPSYSEINEDFLNFAAKFPYDETEDQLKAIDEVMKDMSGEQPLDRLVCGDVGFGKTEVAMRATFRALIDNRQVAVLAPTTVLCFQHLETFRKRFKDWPVRIEALNRFVPPNKIKKIIEDVRKGEVDVVIGTHRLLSKDISFNDLGLLVIDEEQKFGVKHKEKIRQFKTQVDTLTLSATPIPRTLNMGLVGIRDLSLITTPPMDRLPVRTFLTKFNEEAIRRAVEAEIQRGGQIFFLHNRVQSIHGVADELRQFLPGVRIRIGHGQMPERQLEETMLAFYRHEIDMLVCTTIIESGLDIPRANTMFIDNAHTYGLSQLYQLRGRVGRSKERAYCYLLIPGNKAIDQHAQERLRILQEHSELGSGIRIAHYDLELRGAGNILGEDQSGHIHTVGYELYLELLEQAVNEAKGRPQEESLEPDINVRIPALIPDSYIQDIRVRLAFYKQLSKISDVSDLDKIENRFRDQFGKPPEQVINLMGLMLIRHQCKKLRVRDLSSGTKTISLAFLPENPLPTKKVMELVSQSNKKYKLTPDHRLIVRMNEIKWPNIHDELKYLERLC